MIPILGGSEDSLRKVMGNDLIELNGFYRVARSALCDPPRSESTGHWGVRALRPQQASK